MRSKNDFPTLHNISQDKTDVKPENEKDAFSVQALRSQSGVIQYTPASFDISLAYLLENVKDEDLKKYIPADFYKEKTDGRQYAIAKEDAAGTKKEALSLLQRKGLQLPSSLPQDGFIHSIRENGAKINTKFEM